MGVAVSAQMISLAASALGGLLAGLLYDLLRVLRYGAGKAAGVICDLFFCLFCTGAMFLTGMVFCGGRPGFWEPFTFLAVFGLYLFGVSPSIWGHLCKMRRKIRKNAEKRDENAK